MKKIIPAVLLSILLLTGCGQFQEKFEDAPVGDRDEAAADLFNMPDGYSNFASKCDGPNRVYVISKGNGSFGAIAVVPNDARCSK